MSLLHPSFDFGTSHRGMSGSRTFGVLALAAVLLVVLVACLVPSTLVLPVFSLVTLAAAGAVALAALVLEAPHRGDVTLWDIAGVLALLGCVAAMLSETEHVVAAFGLSPAAMMP